MAFQQLGRREVVGRFDGGRISSDAGGLLLREVEGRFGILKRLVGCFRDYRDRERIEHSLESLISQRVYGIALGYEDLNDHDSLRHDVVMGVLCEKSEPTGGARLREQDRGKAIAGKSTLNRLELTPEDVRIIVRGDSGFCRDQIMSYCEQNPGLEYVLGLAKNTRLIQQIAAEMAQAQQIHQSTQQPARVFKDFRYRTRHSWSCERRVVGKAEYLAKGENPRFVVTSIISEEKDARTLYEDFYCARGDMENRIKGQQLGLFADRTSTSWMRSNQV
jgi:hypothetical protein